MRAFSKMRIFSIVFLPVLVFSVLACGGGDASEPTAAPEEKEPFRIGVMESVTGPGETYGTVSVQAKEMAVAEINASGGINGPNARAHRRRLKVQCPGFDYGV